MNSGNTSSAKGNGASQDAGSGKGSSTHAWVGGQTIEHARYRNTYSAGMINGASGAAGTNQSRNGSDRGSSTRADVGSVRAGGATSRNIESGGRSQGSGGTSSAGLQSNRDRESDLMGTGGQFR